MPMNATRRSATRAPHEATFESLFDATLKHPSFP